MRQLLLHQLQLPLAYVPQSLPLVDLALIARRGQRGLLRLPQKKLELRRLLVALDECATSPALARIETVALMQAQRLVKLFGGAARARLRLCAAATLKTC